MALEIKIDETCNRRRQGAGLPYPRTCAECGLGPCKHSIVSGGKKPIEVVQMPDVLAPESLPFTKSLTLLKLPHGGFVVNDTASFPFAAPALFAGTLSACLAFLRAQMDI